jgi:NAD+ kinase
MQPISSVGLVIRRQSPDALRLGEQIVKWLRARQLEVFAEPDFAAKLSSQPLPKRELAQRSDLIVVLGGDGTLLSVAGLIGARETPVLGVNLGGLGFLTVVTADEALDALARVVRGDYEVDRRTTVEAVLERKENKEAEVLETFRALNDVVLSKRGLGRMLQFRVTAANERFCSYRADGLIVSTATGSTAYALSAGGPIVYPTLEVFILAPICPHALTNRPVVLPDSFELEIRANAPENDATLIIDGHETAQFGAADVVRIRRGRNAVALVRSSHAYFEIWRDKLRWG